jgi:hypoxanthine phosphoribosyltransferase
MSPSASYQTKPLISERDIQIRVHELACELAEDYREKFPLVIGILKGSFVFLADLIREMEIPLQVDFVRVSSYRNATSPQGHPDLLLEPQLPITDRHLLVVDDIVDTGRSLAYLVDYLNQQQPSSIKLCTLLDKPSRREVSIVVDYVGFTVPDLFVVGYGIDVAEEFRYLKEVRMVAVK